MQGGPAELDMRPPWAWPGTLAVVSLAVLLRLPHLTNRSLWYDEASSWQTAAFSWSEMLKSPRLNVHLPLYYVLLKGWVSGLGDSVASLRGFSVLFGGLTVLGMGLFAREMYQASCRGEGSERDRERFSLVVAAVIAISPFQVLGAVEARMYSLGTALTAFGSWLLLRIVNQGGRSWSWWAYAAISVCLLYTHHYGAFTIVAQFVFLIVEVAILFGRAERERAIVVLRGAVTVGVVMALAYLPGLMILRGQVSRVRQDYWLPGLDQAKFLGSMSEFLIPTHGFDFPKVGLVVLAVGAASCSVLAIRGGSGNRFVLASALIPIGLAASISVVQPVWLARYLRFSHLFLLTGIVSAFWQLTAHAPRRRAAATLALLMVLSGSYVLFWHYLDIPNGQGVRGAVEVVLANKRDDELIVTVDHHQHFPVKYYAGRTAEVRLVEPHPDLFWGWHLIRPDDLVTQGRLDEELKRGVWLIARNSDPAKALDRADLTVLARYEFRFYHALHRRLFVYHVRTGSVPSTRER